MSEYSPPPIRLVRPVKKRAESRTSDTEHTHAVATRESDNEQSYPVRMAFIAIRAHLGGVMGFLLAGRVALALAVFVSASSGIFFGWVARGLANE